MATQDLHEGLREILSATIELLGADFGKIQLYDPKDRMLRVAAQQGFKRRFLDYFREVSAKDNAPCGRALRGGRRIIIEDVEQDAAFAPHRDEARSAGFRALQSTPLIAHDGRPLGMISTHFRAPHRLSAVDLQSLDLYARQAADFIERCGAEQALAESRESSLAVMDALSAHIAVVDENGKIVRVNESWRRFARKSHGIPGRMNEGANYVNACEKAARNGSENAARMLQGMRDVLAGRVREFCFEYPCHAPDRKRWFIARVTRVADGGLRGVVTAHEDITGRKEAELALLEQKNLLRAITESTPDLIFAKDRESRWLTANPAAFAAIGKTASEVIGRRETDWHDDPREAALLRANDRRIMKSGVAETIEEVLTSAKGETRTYQSTKSPLRDASGRVVGIVGVARDITALKLVEESLRLSAHQVRTLSHAVEQSPASVVITTPTGEIDYVNRKFTEVTGYTPGEVLGKNPRILKSGEQPRKFYKEMWDAITAGREWRGEFCNRRKNGELFWEYAVIAPVIGSDEKVRHFVAIKEDITERRRAFEALRDREERLRAILNTVVDAVITIDRGGIITGVNPATVRMFGHTEAEMVGQNVKMLMPMPYHSEHDRYIENYRRTGERKIIGIGREVRAQRRDGSIFPVELAVSEVNHMGLFTGVIRDISERRKLEEALIGGIEREQRKFGQDLHDGLGQRLTGLEMLSHALARELESRAPALAKQAKRLNDELRDTVTDARRLSHNLAPVALDGGGLMQGLEELARSTSRIPKTRCHFTCKAPVSVENQTVAMHLYRIAQEAVNNALKHGKARRIEITLRDRVDGIEIRVENDGRPFPAHPAAGGIGLDAMRHRASMIGATLRIERGLRGGARVVCSFRTTP